MNKKGFEFNFGWLFAIIVGAIIILLAVYASTRLIETQRDIQDTKLGKQLGIILTPLETGLETGLVDRIILPIETRIYNDCKTQGNFGTQKISTSTKSNIGEQWQTPEFASTFPNKYLFSEKIIQGKGFITFSKPLEMPFKIANLIYIWPEGEEYCFVNPPNEIEDELFDLIESNPELKKTSGVNITSSSKECPPKAKKVCFTTTGCDIDVSYDGKSVKKKSSNRVYYETTALLYGAIFADPEIYECQVKRLAKRASELSLLYYSKTTFLAPKGCSTNLEQDLIFYANQTFDLSNSIDLRAIYQNSEDIRRKNNDLSNCPLF